MFFLEDAFPSQKSTHSTLHGYLEYLPIPTYVENYPRVYSSQTICTPNNTSKSTNVCMWLNGVPMAQCHTAMLISYKYCLFSIVCAYLAYIQCTVLYSILYVKIKSPDMCYKPANSQTCIVRVAMFLGYARLLFWE